MKTSNKKITKNEIKAIKVWTDINSTLVEQFKPIISTTKKTRLVPSMRLLEQTKQQIQLNKQVISNTTTQLTKVQIAQQIFDQERARTNDQLSRKLVIELIMNAANLSKAGASTYFQNMKKEAGMVIPR